MNRAAFLARDEVISVDYTYVHRWEDFSFVRGAVNAMRQLVGAGYQLIVVTNRSGIARGYFSADQYHALTSRILKSLREQSIEIVDVHHWPHHPSGAIACWAVDCDCHKPALGVTLRARADYDLSLLEAILIGDEPSDIAACVGRAFLVRTDNQESQCELGDADAVFDSLADCVASLLPSHIPLVAKATL